MNKKKFQYILTKSYELLVQLSLKNTTLVLFLFSGGMYQPEEVDVRPEEGQTISRPHVHTWIYCAQREQANLLKRLSKRRDKG